MEGAVLGDCSDVAFAAVALESSEDLEVSPLDVSLLLPASVDTEVGVDVLASLAAELRLVTL